MQLLEKTANRIGIRAIAIWSINNTEHPMNDEQKRVRDYILSHAALPDEYDMVIINASSETSINIFSPIDYKPDRTDLDLLFGCLLEWGLPLSLPYTSEAIEGCTVHTYNDGDLIACFDENIPDSVIKTIAKRQPLRAVFRDSSFASSPSKINVGEVFKLLAPDTRVKVI